MGAALPANKMIGAATLDRLRHGAYRVVLVHNNSLPLAAVLLGVLSSL
jgi:hypothetical protein